MKGEGKDVDRVRQMEKLHQIERRLLVLSVSNALHDELLAIARHLIPRLATQVFLSFPLYHVTPSNCSLSLSLFLLCLSLCLSLYVTPCMCVIHMYV